MVHRILSTAFLTLSVACFAATCVGQIASNATASGPELPVISAPAEIPLEVFSRIVYSFASPNEASLDLPAAQKEAMKKASAAHVQVNGVIGQIAMAVSHSGLTNRRFTAAAAQLKAEQDAVLLNEWRAIVTEEQQATIRRKNRAAIMQASLQRQNPQQALLYGMMSADALMTNNDLLSVVERPAIQDQLEITDEQLAKIMQLQQAAEIDALLILRQCKEMFVGQKTANVQNPYLERLQADTRQILTKEQSDQYDKIQQDRLMQAKGVAPAVIRSHGMPVEYNTKVENGKATVHVKLFNGFAEPSIVEMLKLTEQQQTQLSQRLEQAEEEFISNTVKQIELHHNAEQALKDKLNEQLKRHNEQFQSQVVAILTDEQSQRLQKERLRGLGVRALEKTEVKKELQLTSEQSAAIAAILQKPAPAFPVIKPPVNAEDFRRHSDEFQAKSREHGRLVDQHVQSTLRQIEEKLSTEQKVKFTEMVGFQFPRAARP